MVYKKYIKRNGKTFGPYYYESYRENGKVKTRFISGPKENDKKNFKKIYIGIAILLLIIIGASYYFYNNQASNETKKNIIEIISADIIDSDQNSINNIFKLVNKKDNNWATINDSEIIRIEFEKNLSQGNDISFYARSEKGGRVDIYPDGGELLMSINVDEDKLYRNLLTGLKKATSIFHLKIFRNIDFDYIFDPDIAPTLKWNATFYQGLADDVAQGIDVSLNDSVYVVGNSSNNWSIQKYNATNGNLIINFSGADTDCNVRSVVVSPNESIYVVGKRSPCALSSLVRVTKFNSSGDHVWNNTDTAGSSPILYGIALDNKSGIYSVGVATSILSFASVSKYNDSNGSTIWDSNFSTNIKSEIGYGVVADNYGFVYIVGDNGTEPFVAKFNSSNGTQIYNFTYSSSGVDKLYSIDYYNDSLYVTGSSNSGVLIRKYNATNQSLLWSSNYSGDGDYNDTGKSVNVDGAGNAYVGGNDTDKFVIVKFSGSDGSVIWNITTDHNGTIEGISLDPNNDIYITGTFNNTFLTRKFGYDNPPTSTPSSPANATSSDLGSVTFECNGTDDINLANVTLYIWNSSGSIINSSNKTWTGLSNTSNWTHNFNFYNVTKWNCLVYDNRSQSDWGINRTLTIQNLTVPGGGGGSSGGGGGGGGTRSDTNSSGNNTKGNNSSNNNTNETEKFYSDIEIIETKPPEGFTCNSKYGKCRGRYNLNNIVGNNVILRGYAERKCANADGKIFIQKKTCNLRNAINIKKFTEGGKKNVQIFDKNGKFLGIIKIIRIAGRIIIDFEFFV